MSRFLLVAAALLAVAAPSARAACANDCSGNGYCNVNSACECYRNWIGNDCSQRLCYYGRAFVDSPQGDINSNGYYDVVGVPSRAANSDTWESYSTDYGASAAAADLKVAWTPAIAAGQTFWSEAHFYAECSNKGKCLREEGLCECWTGYEGSGCERLSCPTTTETPCSGHGVCERLADSSSTYAGWDAEKTQACKCDPGYTGISCSKRVCPSGDDPITKYVKATKLCFPAAHGLTVTSGAWVTVYGSASGAIATFATGADYDTSDTKCYYVINVNNAFFQVGEKVLLATGASHGTDQAISTIGTNGVRDTHLTAIAQTKEMDTLTFTNAVQNKKFALTYVDEFGHSWTTKSIDISGTVATLKADVEAALQALPNKVLADVQVEAAGVATTANAYGTTFTITVQHVSNTGNQAVLALYAGGDTASTVVITHQEGTTENIICSGRGTCDYETGQCHCFLGFMKDDCSLQNALAMH